MEDMFLSDIVLLEKILDGSSGPEPLKLAFLEYMTDNFSETREAGKGGFGVVYRGEFKNRIIAVKKLTFSEKAEKEFDREIKNLLRVNHKNIVRLLGYCNNRFSKYMNVANPGEPEILSSADIEERIICFEYITNGSLRDHIDDELRGLDWPTRYKIIRGICQALDYLHNKKHLVHRDLKPDNILLDNLMVPKIADLGISKLLDDGVSSAKTTNTSMSWVYAPPEFKDDGVVSFQYDIYSLGLIMTEIVTGKRKIIDVKSVLTRWRHRWNKSNETLRYKQVAKCIEIGLSCTTDNCRKRPSISKIIKDLDEVDGGNGTVRKEIPRWNDLLWIEPQELFFPFQINKKISCSLILRNETHAHMAFFIKTYRKLQYKMDPEQGIVQPCSAFTVNIILLPQEKPPEKMQDAEEFTVRSTRVNEGLAAEDITREIFSQKSGNIVDKTRLGVVFDAQLRAPCMVEKVNDEEPNITPPNSDHLPVESGIVHVEVNDEEPTTVPPNSGPTWAPSTEPGRVHLVIKSNKTTSSFDFEQTVMLELTGGDCTSDRPGLDLVLILDFVSTSSRSRIQELQIAMQFVVHKLSPIDRLSLVTLAGVPTKLRQVTASARQELLELINDRIKASLQLGNNILDGLLAGIKVLADRKVSAGRISAIILVSNNWHNIDILPVHLNKVSLGNVPVYTFCFGSENGIYFLRDVADMSLGGTFSFIHDEELSGGLTMAISQCLAGLLTVSVQDLELTVAPVEDKWKIVKMSAGTYPKTVLNYGDGSVTVRFGNLYNREVRKVIVDLSYLGYCREGGDHSIELLKVTYSYSSSSSTAGRERFERPVNVWRTMTIHGDILEEEKPWLTELHAEKARLQAAEFIQNAVFERGFSLPRANEMLVEAEKIMQDDGFNPLLTTELQVLHQLFQTDETYMNYGHPYALSVVCSHDRQRSAARGMCDMEIMRLFATPCMDLYLEQARKFYKDMRLFATPCMDLYLEQARKFYKDTAAPPAQDKADIPDEVLGLFTWRRLIGRMQ